MNEYQELYKQAMLRSEEIFGSKYLPNKMSIDLSLKDYSTDVIKNALIADFQEFIPSTNALVGSCFKVVREASYVLNELGVPHYLTIGDVTYKGKPYYRTTVGSIFKEIKQGYVPHAPANAHAWLTLESGQVVDLTILSSVNKREHPESELPWSQAIYVSSSEDSSELSHTPILQGFGYHLNVVSHPFEMNYSIYVQWINDFPHFNKTQNV
ncbi:hypothetical protein CTH30272_03045 [Allocatenococcus thiocycli]|nr:hypothetical protein CTH30272_03045 [Catenococcus thiocycli]